MCLLFKWRFWLTQHFQVEINFVQQVEAMFMMSKRNSSLLRDMEQGKSEDRQNKIQK